MYRIFCIVLQVAEMQLLNIFVICNKVLTKFFYNEYFAKTYRRDAKRSQGTTEIDPGTISLKSG